MKNLGNKTFTDHIRPIFQYIPGTTHPGDNCTYLGSEGSFDSGRRMGYSYGYIRDTYLRMHAFAERKGWQEYFTM